MFPLRSSQLIIVCIMLMLGSLVAKASEQGVVLVREGTPASVIVIDAQRSPAATASSQLLVAWVQDMSGAELPVMSVTEANLDQMTQALSDQGKTVICVGQSAWTDRLGISVDDWAVDEFVLASKSDAVVILGRDDTRFEWKYDWVPNSAGTLYATQRFIESLGGRWFYPGEENRDVPRMSTIRWDGIQVRTKPYFPYRFSGRGNRWYRWAGYGGDGDVWATRHTFEQTYDWHKMFGKTRPHYFSRGGKGGRIGFTHDGVVEEIARQAREYFQSKRPAGKRKYFIVGANDHLVGVCPCDQCQVWVDKTRPEKGWYSDYIAQAVVKVAELLKDDFPDHYIVYLAYERYTLPPTKIDRLPSNVVVLLAQSRLSTMSPEGRQAFVDLVRAWQALKPAGIAFCRYYTFGTSIVPVYFPHHIADDIRLMKELDQTGESPIIGELQFTQMKPDADWWFRLNQYVTARCLWNPDLNIDALLQDFYRSYFGPAAEPMGTLYDLVETAYVQEPGRALYDVEMINHIEQLLSEANALTAGTLYQTRVAMMADRLKPLYAMREKITSGADGQVDLEEALIADYAMQSFPNRQLVDATDSKKKAEMVEVKRQNHQGHKALYFNGESSFVKIPTVKLPQEAYTVSAWIALDRSLMRRNTYEKMYILGPQMYDRAALYIQNQRLTLLHRDSEGNNIKLIAPPLEYLPHQWYHVAGTFSAKNGMSLYINGELVAYDVSVTTPPDKGYGWLMFIGATGVKGGQTRTAGNFEGWIRNVHVYRDELTLQQMSEMP